MSALFHSTEKPNITVPHEANTPEFFAWCAQLASEACSNLYILRDEKGYTKIVLERGTNGRLDATIDCGTIDYHEIETLALNALTTLEATGSHTVRWTSRGVRAFLRADWTQRFTGRVNEKTPGNFDANSCRPWRCQPIPDSPTEKLVDEPRDYYNSGSPATCAPPNPWSDNELASVGG